MDNSSTASKFDLFFLLLFLLSFVCSSGSLLSDKPTIFRYQINAIRRDFMSPPMTTFPTTPVTNPVTTPSTGMLPPTTPTPTIVTVPSTNPIPTPVANPMNPPAMTNPVTTPSTTLPQPTPTPTGGMPVTPGQSWCVARSGVPDSAVQAALDYACGIGGADCTAIQEGASCYNPNTLQYHASYAFNSYYQRNPVPTSCDFSGTATIITVNPSTGSCVFTTGSPSIASPSPTTTSPTNTIPMPTPTTQSSTSPGAAQPLFNASNPALGGGTTGYGDNPSIGNTSSVSASSNFQPFICCIVAATSIITRKIILEI